MRTVDPPRDEEEEEEKRGGYCGVFQAEEYILSLLLVVPQLWAF